MPRVEPILLTAQLRRMAAGSEALTDAELVTRYAEHRDAAAFEVLVWRHGPMVWATCRRILAQQHDTEDAFQATFLALARTARAIGTKQAVAGWLHRVATNAALKLKSQRRSTELRADLSARTEADPGELAGVVDEELDRLPVRLRVAFVLCCLEGMTSAEAARELGCPVGTIDSRLHAARARLRDRLTRRGFGPAVLTGFVLTAAPPAGTLAAAIGASSGVSLRPAVEVLAGQASRMMGSGVMTMKTVAIAVLVVAFTGAVWAIGGPGDAPAPTPKSASPVAPAGQAPAPAGPGGARAEQLGPRAPGGVFGDRLGEYHTIEGIRAEGGKIESGTLLVDTVDGKKLDKPIGMVVRPRGYPTQRLDLPAKKRCVFKGYELGEMIGRPPAEYNAAKERGEDADELVKWDAVPWHWRPYFVVLIAVEPKGLEGPQK